MMARMLKMLLLAQLLAAGALWVLAVSHWGAGRAGAAAAAVLALVLLLRLCFTLHNFIMARRFAGAGAARLGWPHRLRLFAREFYTTMLSSSWTMVRHRGIDRHFADSPALPVLLIHGYGCNGGYWQAMSAALSAARISHRAIDLEPVLAAIDDYVPAIDAAVAALAAAHGGQPVILLGHSMGGLAIRAYLRQAGTAAVARAITLGTPHHGTGLANRGVGQNCRQMRGHYVNGAWRPSAWLKALDSAETPAVRSLLTSIYSLHDNIVSPAASACLSGAENIAFEGVGHVALAFDASVQRQVIAQIMAASAHKR
jgi:triacylglycerol lipase